jgi:hypothetical protein
MVIGEASGMAKLVNRDGNPLSLGNIAERADCPGVDLLIGLLK